MTGIVRRFPDIPFESLNEGDMFETTFDVRPELVATYNRLIGQVGDEAVDRTDAPPWVYCTFLPMFQAMDGRMEQGSIHSRQATRIHRPIQIGAKLAVEVQVDRAFVRNGRRHVVLSVTFRDSGRVTCTMTGTFLWGHANR